MDNDELYERISRLQWLIERGLTRGFPENYQPTDPNSRQGRILALLKLKDNVSTTELAYLLGIRESRLTEPLDRLEKNGLISRQPSTQPDTNETLVSLIEAAAPEEEPKTTGDFFYAFDALSEEDLVSFSGYVDKIIAAYEAKLGNDAVDTRAREFSHVHYHNGERYEARRSRRSNDEERVRTSKDRRTINNRSNDDDEDDEEKSATRAIAIEDESDDE
jgi:DNA-binding MarR family transcriptional regulator